MNSESISDAVVVESATEPDAMVEQGETNQTELALSSSPVTGTVADHLEQKSVGNFDKTDQADMPEKQQA